MMTMNERLASLLITMTAKPTDKNPGMDSDRAMDHWRCTFKRPGFKPMTVLFSMGSGHNGKAPDADEVIDCLVSDASGSENSFADFCAEYGYDNDSRKAERTYKACRKIKDKLTAFLGDEALRDFTYETERL